MAQRDFVEVVIPVYNEEAVLEKNSIILNDFLEKNCKIPWKITIFSNGSTDNTVNIGTSLNKLYPKINFRHIPEKGKARTLRLAWESSNASIVGFMDADLSTGLDAFPKCLQTILDGADMAIGNRLSSGAVTDRSFKRKIISRGWNSLVKLFFPFTAITDTQCGFKFLQTPVIKKLLPEIKDNNLFFDTELLMLAEHSGYKISQIPVHWVERKASKIKPVRAIKDFLFRLAELRLRLWKK